MCNQSRVGLWIDGVFFDTCNQDFKPSSGVRDEDGSVWILDKKSASVYNYSKDGYYTNKWFSVALETCTPSDFWIYNGYFCITCNLSGFVYFYNKDGVYGYWSCNFDSYPDFKHKLP